MSVSIVQCNETKCFIYKCVVYTSDQESSNKHMQSQYVRERDFKPQFNTRKCVFYDYLLK